MAAVIQTDGWIVRISQPTHTTQAMSEPNPNWEETDENGHTHTYDSRGETWEVNKTDKYYCTDCHAMHWTTEVVCKICGVEVTPGYRPGRPRTHPIGPPRAEGEIREGADGFGTMMEAVKNGEAVDTLELQHPDGTVVELKNVLPMSLHKDHFGIKTIEFETREVDAQVDV